MTKKRYYSIREVAEYFDVSPDLIRKLCHNGSIPGAKRLGNLWRIPAEFLEQKNTLSESKETEKPEEGNL